MMKKLLSMALCGLLLVSLCPGAYAAEAAVTEEKPSTYTAEEVIYSILTAQGEPEQLVAVVLLEGIEPEQIEYYGDFSLVKNLTDTREIDLESDVVSVEVGKEKLFFQGQLEKGELPWLIDISYSLDGQEISPEALGGESGRLEIAIETRANPQADAAFFEAYMLQISVSLDMELCSNIDAPGASVANSGGSKMLSFVVMPNTEGSLKLTADVENFSMDGITIAGIPYSMGDSIEGLDDISGGINTLISAIGQLNSGASSLSEGMGELNKGSEEFGKGLLLLSENSAQLVEGSEQILGGIEQISDLAKMIQELGADLDLSSLEFLPGALSTLASGLNSAAEQLESMPGNMDGAVDAISQSLNSIVDISQEELDALQQQNPDSQALKLLIANHRIATGARDAWNEAVASFEENSEGMNQLIAKLREAANTAQSLSQAVQSFLDSGGLSGEDSLIGNLAAFADQYTQFHEGLVEYTGGVDALAEAWPELQGGISQIGDGTSQLADGTGQLNAGTQGVPEQIDELLSSYTGGDFEPRSFLSEKNENTVLVQFVVSTEPIRPAEEALQDEEQAEEKSGLALLIDRLTALF